MKKLLALSLSAAVGVGAITAYAGGPIVIEDEAEVVAEDPATSVGILPLILGVVVLCAVICDGEDEQVTKSKE